jgi:hypothetical protein
MNRLRLFLNRNYLFALLQGVVQKIATKERKNHKEKIILLQIILPKKFVFIRVNSWFKNITAEHAEGRRKRLHRIYFILRDSACSAVVFFFSGAAQVQKAST